MLSFLIALPLVWLSPLAPENVVIMGEELLVGE